MQTEPTEQSKN